MYYTGSPEDEVRNFIVAMGIVKVTNGDKMNSSLLARQPTGTLHTCNNRIDFNDRVLATNFFDGV